MEQVILKNKADDSLVYTSDSKSFIIGRAEKAQCLIPVQGISKVHAEVLPHGSNWYLRDLGSTNGTYLNSVPLLAGELYLLRPNDELSFGTHLCYIGASKFLASDPSLSLFKEDVYQGEFFIGQSTSFSYGGINATIPAKEFETDDMIFLVKREGSELIVVQKNREIKASLNGAPVEGRVNLKDRDQLSIANLNFFVSIQVPLTADQVIQKQVEEAAAMPDYLKDRIGDGGWGDPLPKRKNAGTLLSIDSTLGDETKKFNTSATGLGVNRFSTTRLRIQEANVKKEKSEFILGVFTIVTSIFMGSVLIYLYGFN